MRWMAMAAAFFTLLAAAIGVATLSAFGFSTREILGILVPMAVLVAVAAVLTTALGTWSARMLNRDVEEDAADDGGKTDPGDGDPDGSARRD